MKREELRALGLTDEQVDKIMSMNGDDVNAQKAIVAARDQTITTLTQERDGLKTQVADRDKDIADLKKSNGDNADLQKKLDDLQKKYDTDTANLQKSLDDQARSHAVEGLFSGIEFTSALAKRAAIREFEAAGLEFKDGKFTGADGQIAKLREQYPDAFKPKEDPKPKPKEDDGSGGQPGGNPPKPKFTNPMNGGGDGGNGNNNPFNFNFMSRRDNGHKKE